MQRVPIAITGKVKSTYHLKNGMLLLEVFSDKQEDTLLKSQCLGSSPFQLNCCVSLISSRGVVNTNSLDGMVDEEVQIVLANQSIQDCNKEG
jgi:hypothetical protein